MVVDVLKKLKGEAKARQQRGGASDAAPRFEPAHRFFVSSNWKNLLEKKPKIAPKAAATPQGPPPPDGGATPNFVALDCEMVGVGPGGVRSALARVSIVDHEGRVVMDSFARPCEPVTDYRTHITGITAATLRGPGVLREEIARKRAADLLDGKVVVGHSVHNDFQALILSHPHVLIRDTALFRPLRPAGREKKTPSLTTLAQHWLHETIHGGKHDSVEDARIALRLYRLKSRMWEKQLRSVMKTGGSSPGRVDIAPIVDDDDDQGERVDDVAASSGATGAASSKQKHIGIKKKGAKVGSKKRKIPGGGGDAEARQGLNPGKKMRKKQRRETLF